MHGGQDMYEIEHLVEDFSVTTNYMGPSLVGLQKIQQCVESIQHYPKEDGQPYKSVIARFLFGEFYTEETEQRLILGNGASELIDLAIRTLVRATSTTHTYYAPDLQYMEYARACENASLEKTNRMDQSDVICFVNPCNPSGTYDSLTEMKLRIHSCKRGSVVLVDESMQFWKGSDYRKDSLISQTAWIQEMHANHGISIYVIHSWTKFFSCTGIRIGTIWSPSQDSVSHILHYKTPWSCNILALEYLASAVTDTSYIETTWKTTRLMRSTQCAQIQKEFPSWKIHGADFLSWMWIECPNAFTAIYVYEISKTHGMPIRWGGMGGYNRPQCIRVAVRKMEVFAQLLDVWKDAFSHNEPIPFELKTIHLSELICHEEILYSNGDRLCSYLESLENYKTIPTIIADKRTNMIIDGHHRFHTLSKLNIHTVPVLFVDYRHPSILVNVSNLSMTKEIVERTVQEGKLLPPKSTRHAYISKGEIVPIVCMARIISV
jgi:histidinol-phosphate/aromatic aminotransferase/cobyric acid decarboxylase-like protein